MKNFSETASADDVLREVWRIKDALSASYDHDVARLFAITRQHERENRAPRCLDENLRPIADEKSA